MGRLSYFHVYIYTNKHTYIYIFSSARQTAGPKQDPRHRINITCGNFQLEAQGTGPAAVRSTPTHTQTHTHTEAPAHTRTVSSYYCY